MKRKKESADSCYSWNFKRCTNLVITFSLFYVRDAVNVICAGISSSVSCKNKPSKAFMKPLHLILLFDLKTSSVFILNDFYNRLQLQAGMQKST